MFGDVLIFLTSLWRVVWKLSNTFRNFSLFTMSIMSFSKVSTSLHCGGGAFSSLETVVVYGRVVLVVCVVIGSFVTFVCSEEMGFPSHSLSEALYFLN